MGLSAGFFIVAADCAAAADFTQIKSQMRSFDKLRNRAKINTDWLAQEKKFTQNLLEKFTPNLLSPALAELDFQSPLDCAFF